MEPVGILPSTSEFSELIFKLTDIFFFSRKCLLIFVKHRPFIERFSLYVGKIGLVQFCGIC